MTKESHKHQVTFGDNWAGNTVTDNYAFNNVVNHTRISNQPVKCPSKQENADKSKNDQKEAPDKRNCH